MESILSITRGENLWGGCDYLPNALEDLLREEHMNGKSSKIKSFVFIHQKQVIGFRYLEFQSKSCAVKLAFRIKKEYRGLGLGRQITKIFEDHLEKSFPKNLVTLSCVPDWDLSDEQLKSPKFGDLLLIRPYLVYCFKPSQTVANEGREEDCIDIKVISTEEFKHVLQTKTVREKLLENDILHIDFTPIVLDNDEAVEYAANKDQVVMVEGVPDHPRSMSILTKPYNVPHGRLCAGKEIR